jgi:hypothetical protein
MVIVIMMMMMMMMITIIINIAVTLKYKRLHNSVILNTYNFGERIIIFNLSLPYDVEVLKE